MQGRLRGYVSGGLRQQRGYRRATCAAIASRIKLDVRLFSAAVGSGAINERVTASARRAFGRGAFGVLTFFVGDRTYWGNDRLVLLEHYLAQQGCR